ncbi:class I SAM-dependent methyltransferase [Microvirga arabica]|uniref:class I SAM-dependent methyltransferase n=1 Tax=Microvirga arabica TaxID=1128671 RepID=UPI001939F215|nr:methyltransferase domain-containing protein [Microvirga arabica]MBM1169929.1 class I SAM-dependent methyltransferase [Microvirga arabica]
MAKKTKPSRLDEEAVVSALIQEGYPGEFSGKLAFECFRDMLDDERRSILDNSELFDDSSRLRTWYRLPRSPKEAHMLFGMDAPRVLKTFLKVLAILPSVAPFRTIVDLGAGTGSLARLISQDWPDCRIICTERERNLVDIGRAASKEFPNIEFVEADHCSLPETGVSGDVLISVIGFDLVPQTSNAASAPSQVEGIFKAWHEISEADAKLICIARIPTPDALRSFLSEANRAGWAVDLGFSDFVYADQERFPALLFTRTEADTQDVDPQEVDFFWTLFGF